MYDAKIHPEQYSNTLSTAQITQLHKSIQYVCSLAVETRADSSKFPEEWLFKHRWGKGKKDSKNQLPNGAKIVFMTVGGRTSAVVPSVQKKTGKVAGDVKKEDLSGSEADALSEDDDHKGDKKPKVKAKPTGTKRTGKSIDDGDSKESEAISPVNSGKRSARAAKVEPAAPLIEPKVEKAPTVNGTAPKSRKRKSKAEEHPDTAEEMQAGKEPDEEESDGGAGPPKTKKRKPVSNTTAKASSKPMANTTEKRKSGPRGSKVDAPHAEAEVSTRRRSGRLSGGG